MLVLYEQKVLGQDKRLFQDGISDEPFHIYKLFVEFFFEFLKSRLNLFKSHLYSYIRFYYLLNLFVKLSLNVFLEAPLILILDSLRKLFEFFLHACEYFLALWLI